MLTPARELKRAEAGASAWTLEMLAALPQKGKSAEREALRRLLTNATVIVSASLGGLDKNGLLSGGATDGAAEIADASTRDETAWPRGFRVLGPGDPGPGGTWKEALRLPLTNGEEDEPPMLSVLVLRDGRGERAGDPAIGREQELDEHHGWAADEAGRLAEALGLSPDHCAMVEAAAGAHDLGKARELWQNAMRAPRGGRPYAKTTAAGDPARLRIGKHSYRHEFGSLRDIEADPAALEGVPEELRELALHLVAAHHGFARPLIAPADPVATPAESAARAAAVALRFARLQRDWGPWGLAWWEALLRAADWRASARNDAAGEQEDAAAASPPAAEAEPA